MDWGRAKTILIVVFLILNAFLLVNISINKLSKNDSKEVVDNAIAILENKDVKVECEIPGQDKTMAKLRLSNEEYFNMDKIKAKLIGNNADTIDVIQGQQALLDKPRKLDIKSETEFAYSDSDPQENWNITEAESAEKQAQKFLKSIGINYSEFKTDVKEKTSEGDWKIEFIQKYKGYYIFSNRISVIIGGKGIELLEYHVKKPEISEQNKIAVTAAYKVLLTNYGNLPGVVITAIDMGYNINKSDENMKDYLENPVWRIKTRDGNVRFFDAYTGIEK